MTSGISLVTFVSSFTAVWATTNVDSNFAIWPGNMVNYYLDEKYTQPQQTILNSAILKIQSDLNGCVIWNPVPPTSPLYKLKITAWTDTGIMEPYCYGAAGVNTTLRISGSVTQRLVITPGPSGCMDGSLHGPMHFFAVAMGKRHEHQRGDRNNSITVNTNNFADLGNAAYRLYDRSESYWGMFPYDPCSITHNQPNDFAKPGLAAFTVQVAPNFIPKLDQLSNTDFQLLSILYGNTGNCNRAKCPLLNCAAQRPT